MEKKTWRMRAIRASVYGAVVLLAVALLYVGYKAAVAGLPAPDAGGAPAAESVVTKIVSRTEEQTVFEAEARGGETVTATQDTSEHYLTGAREAEVGDRVIVTRTGDGWVFVDYVRIYGVLILGGVFAALLLAFGRFKGVGALLSLGLTGAAVFAVFLPAFLSGKNIYAYAIAVCVFSTVFTLSIVSGMSRKTLAAIGGCVGGVLVACLLTLLMNSVLHITGVISEDTMYLATLPTGAPVDMKAVVFAGTAIGAVGAVMDVAMSVSSALWELKRNASHIRFGGLFKSGMNIGRDIMGTMTNTLVLAYIGNSLSILLLLVVYINSFTELFNNGSVIVELLQSIVGSFGILAAMPLTTLICALLYQNLRVPAAEGGGARE
ncbi:MAG: YibE/F family protein [Oscillospiraceae bacterium]|nr:YibE/F family protein [Oscillospiraceae bacterium]